jgi:hypothetical protein
MSTVRVLLPKFWRMLVPIWRYVPIDLTLSGVTVVFPSALTHSLDEKCHEEARRWEETSSGARMQELSSRALRAAASPCCRHADGVCFRYASCDRF